MAENYDPRDWMLPTTAGAYQCLCWECSKPFIGYKRSVRCRACTPDPMPRVEERNAGASPDGKTTAHGIEGEGGKAV